MTELLPLHGGQLREIADRFGIPVAELLDFSANINPDGPPATVLSFLRASLDNPSIITHYPDLDETQLRQSLARYAGVRPENIAVANGFVPLLDAALRVLPIRTCLVPVPAFVEYRRALKRSRMETIPHTLTVDSDFSFTAADLFGSCSDAILLANPQNPSGILSSPGTLLRIIEEASERKMYVLLDEAFIDYRPEASLVREIERFPHLIVFRSLTKFFGMAGLRVAYAAAHTEICRQMQDVIPPWPITSLASLAARLAVQDESYVQHTIALNERRRDKMRTVIQRLGIDVCPSAANFLFLSLPGFIECGHLWESLIRDHRIVLRNCANYEGLSGRHLRAAVRTDRENERLIEALAWEVKSE